MSGASSNAPLPSPSAPQNSRPAYNQQFAQSRPSASPAPLNRQISYGSHGSNVHSGAPQTPLYQAQSGYQYNNSPTPVVLQQNPPANYNHYQGSHTAPRPAASGSHHHSSGGAVYNPPRAVEVYTLGEPANSAIPADIRAQFHHDESGKVIFYTAPPLDIHPVPREKQTLGHSLRYLADKARSKEEDEKKRKARAIELEAAASERLKRLKTDTDDRADWIMIQKLNTLAQWNAEMERGTDELYQKLHAENWKDVRDDHTATLAARQEQTFAKERDLDSFYKQRAERKEVKIEGFKWI